MFLPDFVSSLSVFVRLFLPDSGSSSSVFVQVVLSPHFPDSFFYLTPNVVFLFRRELDDVFVKAVPS